MTQTAEAAWLSSRTVRQWRTVSQPHPWQTSRSCYWSSFLVTTVFPKDKGLALVLPQEESEVSSSNVIHFLVDGTGSVGVRRGASELTQLVRSQDVADVWRTGVAENPSLIALVRTDQQAAYGAMVDVLDQLRTAGADRVSLAVNER